MRDPARDQHRDDQVREDHAGPVDRLRRGVVVVAGVTRQGQVERELPAGEHRGEGGHGARASTQQGRDQGDRGADTDGDGGGGHEPADLAVRRDAQRDRDETEQHGTRRRRTVRGHGPAR